MAAEERTALTEAMTHGSVIAWRHINLLGEYDFSDERLQDSVGIKPPKRGRKGLLDLGGRNRRLSLVQPEVTTIPMRVYVPLLEQTRISAQ
jgi:hypothetical protein